MSNIEGSTEESPGVILLDAEYQALRSQIIANAYFIAQNAKSDECDGDIKGTFEIITALKDGWFAATLLLQQHPKQPMVFATSVAYDDSLQALRNLLDLAARKVAHMAERFGIDLSADGEGEMAEGITTEALLFDISETG